MKCYILICAFISCATVVRALPPAFVPNVGQLQDETGAPLPHIDYMLQLPGVHIFLGKGHLHYVLKQEQGAAVQCWRVALMLQGASSQSYWEAHASDALPHTVGMVWPGSARQGVVVYTRLTLRQAAPGTDIVFSVSPEGVFKYDLHTHAAAVPQLRWQVQGATLAAQGTVMQLSTPLGTLEEELPAAWLASGEQLQMTWAAQGDYLGYAFVQAPPAMHKQLVIDPLLRRWATLMGGSGDDAVRALAILPSGHIIWGGSTASTNFPASAGVLTTYQGGLNDAILGRSDALGTVQWATYYGGTLSEEITAVATDSLGQVWAAGRTASPEFVVFDGYDMTFGGVEDGFLLRFMSDGTFLSGTFLGGAGQDVVHALETTTDGYLLAAGTSSSADFPALGAHTPAYAGETDAWLGKFDLTGQPVWLRWLGGSGYDQALDVAADSSGTRYYIAGSTQSENLPGTAGRAQPARAGIQDAYIAAFDSSGALHWATYWGGTDECHGTALALDSLGRPHLAGYTFSTDFPVQDAWQPARAGTGSEGFVAQFDTLGQCRWSTYLGGTDFDFIYTLVINPLQHTVYVSGRTASTDFPVADAGFLASYRGGNWDAFVTELDSAGAVVTSLYYGGAGDDEGLALAASATRTLLGGRAGSGTAFPLLNAWQFFYAGGTADAFIISWDYSSTPTHRVQAAPGSVVLRAWPVPALHRVYARLPQGYMATGYSLYDMTGRRVAQGADTQAGIDVSHLPAGIYSLQVKTPSQDFVARVVVQ